MEGSVTNELTAEQQLADAQARVAELEQQLADAQAAPPSGAPPAEPPTPDTTVGPLSDDYTGLTLEAHRDAEGGRWRFGVTMGGAFIVLLERKLGSVDDDLREVQQPGFLAQRADLYQREQLAQRG